jgi:hypothetical protein
MKQIQHCTGKVLFEAAVATVKELLLAALLAGANLRGANLRDADLSGADLRGSNLRDADLRGSNLRGSNLSGANLRYANLSGADLSGADLSGSNLSDADLSGSNLSDANLRYANLSGANLRYANLSGADLRGSNLSGAILRYADLSGANLPSPTMVLLASWGTVSPSLCRDLMAYDAACHPNPSAFTRWAKGESGCPYSDVKVQRAAVFVERREHWDETSTMRRPFDLMTDVLAEKCPPWTEEQMKVFAAKFVDKTTL